MKTFVHSSRWHGIGASVRGANHEQLGQKNQDALALRIDDRGSLLAAVADGHGNSRSFRSEWGAQFAVTCALQELSKFIRISPDDQTLSQIRRLARATLPHAILQAWRAAVRSHLIATPLQFSDFAMSNEVLPILKPDEELSPSAALTYGTTLLAVAATERYLLFVQLGDGDSIVVSSRGEVTRPLAGDPRIVKNATPSLCGTNPYPSFRIAVLPAQEVEPALIMIATDGYANCYGTVTEFDTVGTGILTYARSQGVDLVETHLESWLQESTRKGSGDDISTAILIRDGLRDRPWKQRIAD